MKNMLTSRQALVGTVLLALATLAAAQAPGPAAPEAAASPAATPVVTLAVASRSQASESSGAAPARPQALQVAAVQPRQATVPADASSALVPVVAEAGPDRLRAESDARALLRVSGYLSEPTSDAARRATSALLWKALNADPAEFLRATAALQKLEGELVQLHQAAGQTRAEMAALRQRLDGREPDELFSTRNLQFLLLVLLLTAGTAFWFWWHSTRALRAGPGAHVPEPAEVAPQGVAERQSVQPAPVSKPPLEPRPPQQAPQSDGRWPDAVPASPELRKAAREKAQRPEPAPVAVPVAVPVLPPRHAETAPALRVETLAATFEEVEFLSSLGLWNDAMDVLKTYLEDSGAPAPLAFYELMRLCMNTDDAATLVSVRKRYAQVFGKEAPKFDQINSALGLEGYPDLATRVARVWRTPEALDLIALCLFTVPAPDQAFSLRAGRDLLFLHDLALQLQRDGQTAPVAASDDASAEGLAPWAGAENADQARELAQAVADTSSGHRFALDVDLTASAEEIGETETPDLDDQLMKQFQEALKADAGKKKAAQDDADAFSAAVAHEKVRGSHRL